MSPTGHDQIQTQKLRVGITGADGVIGSALRAGLRDQYEVVSFTKDPTEWGSVSADLSQADQIRGIFSDLDVVIHLAADKEWFAEWESVRTNNMDATFQVISECVRSGVKKLIFASSNHTQHGDTLLTNAGTLDANSGKLHRLDEQPNPDSLYAVSKLFGENLGKLFSSQYDLQFVALRLGWVVKSDDPTEYKDTESESYMRATYLSHRDCVEAFKCALSVDKPYLVAYAASNNTRTVFDMKETQSKLGFVPKDDAERWFEAIPCTANSG